MIFLAGLQNVPEELYEAARIDGAGPVQQFRHVTLPELGPTFIFVGVFTGDRLPAVVRRAVHHDARGGAARTPR